MLRAIYHTGLSNIEFAFANSPEPAQFDQLADGNVKMLWQSCVPLPNHRPETWNDDNCTGAFQAVCEAWEKNSNSFELFLPIVRALELTATEFSRWITAQGMVTVTFWVSSEDESKTPQPKKLSEKRAIVLANEYITAANAAGKAATQLEFERYAKDKGVAGNRDTLRDAFKRVVGVPLKRGPPVRQR